MQTFIETDNIGRQLGKTAKDGSTPIEKLTEFLTRCRQQMKGESNLFWVAIQTNLLADLNLGIEDEFRNAFQKMIENLTKMGWILPKLQANMRNQVNIANIEIEKGHFWTAPMESAIEKLKSGSSLIGEVPILTKISMKD